MEMTADNIWSTERVNLLMQQIDDGFAIKNTPFWDNKPEWRAANILFQYTAEEVEEIRKCASDIIYFANNYCYAMTDNGVDRITLRDYQEDVLRDMQDNEKVVFLSCRQIGKAQPLYSTVWKLDGKSTIGELTVGDRIYDASGKLTNVVGIYPQGEKDIYEITFSDGSTVRSCDTHLWTVEAVRGGQHTIELKDIVSSGILDNRGGYRWFVRTAAPVEFQEKQYSIDPYTLGLMLGDGCFSQSYTAFSTKDSYLVEHFNAVSEQYGFNFKKHKSMRKCEYVLCAKSWHGNKLRAELKSLKLVGKKSHNKFIPSEYLYGSIQQRVALLQGLMDTDGHCTKKSNIEFSTVSEQLANEFRQLCESLGIIVRMTKKKSQYTYKGEKKIGRTAYRIKLQLPNDFPYPVFRLERKQQFVRNKRYDWGRRRGIAKVEFVGREQAVCIEVDNNDRLYLTDHFIPTHNTISSGIFMVWYLLFNYDKNLLVLSNVGATTLEIIDKIKVIISNLPFFLKPGMIKNDQMTMKFDNGCRLFGKNTTKNAAIGFAIHACYIDEFAHLPANFVESFWRSVFPTISATKGRMILTSTPNGLNKFYEIYQAAVEGRNEFHPIRVDWWQVPGRDEAWKAKEIANLGSEEDFNQEYGNQFLSSSNLLLDGTTLAAMKRVQTEFKWVEIDDLNDTLVDYDKLRWHPRFDIDSVEDGQFVFSIDTANGGGGDYTVLNIFKLIPSPIPMIMKKIDFRDEADFFSLMQVGIFRSNRHSIEELQVITETLLYKVFGEERVKIVLEMDFKGNLLFERMSNHDMFYDDIFIHTKHSQNATRLNPGTKLNPKNKLEYCMMMKKLVKGARIIPYEKHTFEELSVFGLDKKGSYSSQSGHDDIAMTMVNLTVFFDSPQFYEMVELSYDNLGDKYKDAIHARLNGDGSDGDQFDPTIYRDLM